MGDATHALGNVLVIAEAGVNHNGDRNTAKRMIDVASDAGADFVKFQSFTTENVIARDAPKAVYQERADGVVESQFEMAKKLELTRDDHYELARHCQKRGIRFLSTPFDEPSIELLRELNVSIWKCPSGEITNLPFLRRIGRFRQDILLSTGMANLGEIEEALRVLESAGTARSLITILHCNTSYPTPIHDVNLRALNTIAAAFPGVKVGYSDHTLGIEVPIAATALGAQVIEKHFTLDKSLSGPDHSASLEPDELREMVRAIRNVEAAFGDGIKRPSHSESENKAIVRRSIVAARDIRSGELFSEDNLTAKRPGTGLSPMQWDDIVGREARRDYRVEECIDAPSVCFHGDTSRVRNT